METRNFGRFLFTVFAFCLVFAGNNYSQAQDNGHGVLIQFQIDESTAVFSGFSEVQDQAGLHVLELFDDIGMLAVADAFVDASGEIIAIGIPTSDLNSFGEIVALLWVETPQGTALADSFIIVVPDENDWDDETDDIGERREEKVAGIVGGTVDNTQIICRPHGTTVINVKVDGQPPVYISVGGPSEGNDLPGWKKHLKKLKVLQAGDAVTKDGEDPVPGGTFKIYLVEGTGQDVIDAAKAEFGDGCVVMFPDVE